MTKQKSCDIIIPNPQHDKLLFEVHPCLASLYEGGAPQGRRECHKRIALEHPSPTTLPQSASLTAPSERGPRLVFTLSNSNLPHRLQKSIPGAVHPGILSYFAKNASISALAAFTLPCWKLGLPPPRPLSAWVMALPNCRRSPSRVTRQKA